MKQNLLKSIFLVTAVLFAQNIFAGTYYFYNKLTQFEVVPTSAGTVYATTKADITHAENTTSDVTDVTEGSNVLFYYNICAGYDDLYFTNETIADGYKFAGYKVINKEQNGDGSNNVPTAEEIEAAELITLIPVLNAKWEETGEKVTPETLANSKVHIADKTSEVTPGVNNDEAHDGVLNGLYVATSYTSDGGTVGWHDYPDAYVYLYFTNGTDGINSVATTPGFKYIYDLNGVKTKELKKGVNIVKMNDGTCKKVLN